MIITCEVCGKKRYKPPADIARTSRHFCSQSCAATFNNRTYPRRPRTGKCKLCQTVIKAASTYCDDCRPARRDYSLREIVDTKRHKSSAFAVVRQAARRVANRLGWKSCEKCGYTKHVEIAHRQAISSFSLDEKISIVNAPDNLIPLCPNCHWEFDNLPRIQDKGIEPIDVLPPV